MSKSYCERAFVKLTFACCVWTKMALDFKVFQLFVCCLWLVAMQVYCLWLVAMQEQVAGAASEAVDTNSIQLHIDCIVFLPQL